MDLVVFAGFLVAAGYYINDGNFEGFQPRAVLSRTTLPENEVLGGDDNIYRSTMIERNEKYAQDKADEHWAAIQLQKLKTRGELGTLVATGEREDDSFALYPFDEKPDYRAHRKGPNLDKLRQLKTERFIPGVETPTFDRSQPTEAQWNGPQLPPLTGIDQRSRQEDLAAVTLSGTRNGVLIDDRIQDKPLMEHETRILPKQSDELRVEPLHNYSIDHVMPESVAYEAPPFMPKASVKLNTVFETNNAFAMPASTFGDADTFRPESMNRALKKDTTLAPRFSMGGIAGGVDRTPHKEATNSRYGVNRNTYDSLNFARQTASIDATPLRYTKLPPTRRQEIQNVQYVALDGLPSGPVLRNTAIPRTTQRETITIDGRLAGNVTAPYNHPSYDVSTTAIPGPTNKENNLIERSGLPGVENTPNMPEVNVELPPTLKDEVAMRSFAFTSPAVTDVGHMPVTGTSTKNSNAMRYFEARQSNPDIPSHAPTLLGVVDKKQSAVRDVASNWQAPLDFTDREEQYADVENVAERFAKYARKPTEFY